MRCWPGSWTRGAQPAAGRSPSHPPNIQGGVKGADCGHSCFPSEPQPGFKGRMDSLSKSKLLRL